jgi:coenzyme F420-reducing hydrogenase delta subunit
MTTNRSSNIYVFYCSSDFAAVEPVKSYSESRQEIKAIPLPCSGKIDIPYITKAFETGADGVAVVICRQGECLFLEGNLRARKRAEAVDALLEETGMGKGRVAIIQIKDEGLEQVIRELEDFCERITALPGQQAETGITN